MLLAMINSLPLSATNQGVVGSIPASRTKKEKPATLVAGFFRWGAAIH